MTSDREIEIRITILRYFLIKKRDRSWVEFNQSWNIYDISREEYTQIAPIFENADLSNVKIPDIVNKLLNITKDKSIGPGNNKNDFPSDPIPDKVTIDGFTISTKPVFRITVEYIQEKFSEFNIKYFENALSDEGIDFQVMNNFNAYGTTVVGRLYDGSAKVIGFGISDTAGKSEKTYCSTILHEMIHVYQVQVLNRTPDSNRVAHNEDFKAKMNEINNRSKNVRFPNGWDICTNVSKEEIQSEVFTRSSPICRKLENDYKFVYFGPDISGLPFGAGILLDKMIKFDIKGSKIFKIKNGLTLCKAHLNFIERGKIALVDVIEALQLIRAEDVNNWAIKGDIKLIQNNKKESLSTLEKNKLKKIIESKLKEKDVFDINDEDFIKTDDPYHSIYISDEGEILDFII